jgi:hypothetical protein
MNSTTYAPNKINGKRFVEASEGMRRPAYDAAPFRDYNPAEGQCRKAPHSISSLDTSGIGCASSRRFGKPDVDVDVVPLAIVIRIGRNNDSMLPHALR